MKQLDKTIDNLNEHKFHPAGLHLGHPRENGFQFVSLARYRCTVLIQ